MVCRKFLKLNYVMVEKDESYVWAPTPSQRLWGGEGSWVCGAEDMGLLLTVPHSIGCSWTRGYMS